MNNWSKATLDELCTITIGRTPSRNKRAYWGGDLPWLSIADMNQGRAIDKTKEMITSEGATASGSRLIDPGTVLLSFKLSIGKVAISNIHLYTNEAIAALPVRNPDLVEPAYLFWALKSMDLYLGHDRAAMGATLNKAKLQAVSVPLPPIVEQRRIAAILDQADALRTHRRTAIAQLNKLPQAILSELLSETRRCEMVTVPLASLVRNGDRINYGVIQPGEETGEGVPIIRVSDLQSGRIRQEKLKRIDRAIDSRYARSRLKGDEILLSCVGSIGFVACADESVEGFNIVRAVARIPLSAGVSRAFIAEYLRSPIVQQYFTSELRTVAQPTLNIKQLTETPIELPSRDVQAKFESHLAIIDVLKAAQKLALAELDVLFASLQYRAFRGDL